MARIRTIKPQFFTSETLGRVSRDARLLFASLWTQADKEGRLRWVPRLVLGSTFPYDDDLALADLERMAAELESIGSLERWREDGRAYAAVVNFSLHQRVKGSEAESRLPAPPSSDGAQPAPSWRPTGATVAPKKSLGSWKVEGGSRKGELESGERTRARSGTQTGGTQTDTTRRWTIYDLRSHLGDTRPAPPALQAPQWVGIFERYDDDEIDAALELCVSKAYPLAYFLALFDGDGKRKAPRTPEATPAEPKPRPFVVPDRYRTGLPGGWTWTNIINGWPEDVRREYAQRCKDGEDRGDVYVEIDDRTTA